MLQKKKERQSTLLKCKKLTDKQRQKWNGVMVNELMSSEEIADDDGKFIMVHPLPWSTFQKCSPKLTGTIFSTVCSSQTTKMKPRH